MSNHFHLLVGTAFRPRSAKTHRGHGDWRRDAASGLGRRAGRLRLAELGQLAGRLDYAVVSKARARFAHRLDRSTGRRREHGKVSLLQDPFTA